MNKKILLFVLLSLSLLGICCTSKSEEESGIKFRNVSFSKAFDSSNVKSENFVHVKVDYVEFTQASSATVKDSLNKIVEGYINAPIFEEKTKTLEELAQSLINDYKKQKKEFPDFPSGYELERIVEVFYINDKLVCVKFNEYSFLGGAHPNSVMLYTNIELQTGRTIKLDELFIAGYKDELNKIAEKHFRKERELKPEENLENAGFWFKENKFSVNENFAITKSGLSFFFNDYEITSHAAGPTFIEIPFTELASIVKPSGFISSN
ncbi:MAG: DUF3298 domain-containing protein [Melioribacteraceae bacterium]